MLNHLLKPIVSLGLIMLANLAIADELKAKMLDDNPSYCEIFHYINSGDVPDGCPAHRKTRGVTDKTLKPNTVGFSRAINFEFDSTTLLPHSIEVLNRVLAVIQHEKMSQKTIRLEGHTDIIGTAEYNQQLSEQRALAVKHYLVKNGVDNRRILTVVFGFNKLHDPDHPEAGINRRVEIANLGE